jgi:hypothetical protein
LNFPSRQFGRQINISPPPNPDPRLGCCGVVKSPPAPCANRKGPAGGIKDGWQATIPKILLEAEDQMFKNLKNCFVLDTTSRTEHAMQMEWAGKL